MARNLLNKVYSSLGSSWIKVSNNPSILKYFDRQMGRDGSLFLSLNNFFFKGTVHSLYYRSNVSIISTGSFDGFGSTHGVMDSSPSMPTTTTNLFSTIPAYEVFGSLFDWTFLVSTGGPLPINHVRLAVQGR